MSASSGTGRGPGRPRGSVKDKAKKVKKGLKGGNKTMIICAIVALLAIGGGAFFFRNQIGDFISGLGNNETQPTHAGDDAIRPADGELRVHFIDLGQADGILVHTDTNAILIDAGRRNSCGDTIIAHMESVGVTHLDYFIGTHPHADHIGGAARIINNFSVGHVLLPDATHNTQVFLNMMRAIDEHDIPLTWGVHRGHEFSAGGIHFTFVAPAPELSAHYANRGNDFNALSTVVRVTHGSTAFLFTGDAIIRCEELMLESGINLRADVLQAGHHGSRTSSSEAFIDAVAPSYIAISVGADNSYGHPHDVVVDRFVARNLPILRTDELGTLTFVSDGNRVWRQE